MTALSRRAPQVIAILLVVAAGLFVIGVTAEDDEATHGDEPAAEAGGHDEATEAEGAGSPGAGRAEGETGEDEERVLGIDVESPLLVAAAVLASVLLAGLVWRHSTRRVLVVVTVVGAAFALLDIAEVVHQLEENRTGLALLAGAIATLHAAVAAIALHETTVSPVSAHQQASM